MIAMGAIAVVAGFITLSFTDPWGRNLPSRVSPFLLLGGYALIGVGIMVRDPVDAAPDPSPPDRSA